MQPTMNGFHLMPPGSLQTFISSYVRALPVRGHGIDCEEPTWPRKPCMRKILIVYSGSLFDRKQVLCLGIISESGILAKEIFYAAGVCFAVPRASISVRKQNSS